MNKSILKLVFFALVLSIPFSAFAADVIPPSDVENVHVVSKTATSVTLSWDAATDDKAIRGYVIYVGTKSVKNPEDEYNFRTAYVRNVQRALIMNLNSGTKYYFAVTARDNAGNESMNYSDEVSAKTNTATATVTPAEDVTEVLPSDFSMPEFPLEMNLEGTISSVQLSTGPAFYLNADDGKSYHLLSRALWRKAVLYTRGVFKNGRVRVQGTPAYNTAGHLFGIHYTSIEPLTTSEIPAGIPIGDNLIAKGVIKMRVAYPDGRKGYYLISEDDGREFMLLNTPDWKLARDFMNSKTRVAAYGTPVYNKTGHLYGIRFTDLVPLE
jgi:hypothetical protein